MNRNVRDLANIARILQMKIVSLMSKNNVLIQYIFNIFGFFLYICKQGTEYQLKIYMGNIINKFSKSFKNQYQIFLMSLANHDVLLKFRVKTQKKIPSL